MKQRVYFNLSPVSMTFGGMAVYSWELCHRLMRFSEPLQVVPYTCPFTTLGKRGLFRNLNAILREGMWDNIVAYLGSTKDDYFVFPTHNVPNQFYGRKYAMIILDLAAWHNPSITTWRGQNFVKSLPKSIENADSLFAISDYTAQDVANQFGIPKQNITVAPCGLSEIYKNDVEPKDRINGTDIPEAYFLHVGKFDPKKNLSFLIKVYEQFREITGNTGNSVKLLLTGGQSNVKADIPILEQIRNSPYAKDIIVLGKVKPEDLPFLYKKAIALIFPSTFEGFGLPVIESLSQGTPVLVNANTSLTQFAEFGATVIDDFDAYRWANELKELLDRGRRVDLVYINKVIQYFNWDRTATIIGKSIGLIPS
ncbi:MAG: glycosyltransferase family 1 protein [Nitrososphaeria archaeon]